MSKRTTIALAVINAALLAFILVYERGTLSTTETAGRSNQVLRSFIRDRVERVELERGDEAPIVFVRERDEDPDDGMDLGTWVLTEPLATEADADAVDGLLSALEWLGSRRVREGVTASDREQFGLDEPRFVVRFTVIEQPFELRIGGTAPTGDGVYAEVVGEDRVYVVEDSFVESIDHGLEHFRSKELFAAFYPTGVERVQLDDLLFEREDSIWRVRAPERGWANQGLIDQLTRLPRALNAARFIDEDADRLADYGLDRPWRELTVTRGADVTDHRVARLRVGDACEDHDAERYAIAGDAGPVVCVLVSDLDALTVDRERLREPRLIGVPESVVERVIVTSGDERLELRREEDRWKLYTGPADDLGTPTLADDGAVTAWLTTLRDARALGFESIDDDADVGRGIASPNATIRVVRQGDEPDIEIAVGELDAVGVWVRRGDERALAHFPMAVQEALAVGSLGFRDRQIFEAEAADASRISVTRGEVEERAVRGQGGAWTLESPVEVEADRVVVREIARQLASLRAERFVAERPQSEHGLAPASVTVSATYTPDEGEEIQVTLLIGATTDEGSYAKLSDTDAVFLLGSDRVTALTRSLASLDRLTVDADGLASLRIERGEEVIELTHEAGTWQMSDGAAPHEARTRALMDRLGTLRALGVVAYADTFGPVTMRVVATRRATVEGEPVVTLEIGEPTDDYVPMRRAGLGVIYRMRPDTLQALLGYAP